ncbi:hypothetical protein A3J78_01750 [Candidatus Beckwithbacteria bacterium RBG_13_35_6]|uniref:Probable inosine/xanthosine triphosphatase n=1 Tax=Candidatus Beckwithbacteria bacterium RBG_13_35_6 TaxID=1797456 RepID=A0A1F5DHI9_9BACT|nr:MAG: hypothetical protein A3J78_01750 [Candidatus Beckwithbacteria bacterium RBG_13_35_6]
MKRKEIIVIVGSENPVKTKAVREVFIKAFKKVKVEGLKINSGVSDQPMSFEQAYIGALNRARKALKKFPESIYSVGIEAGIQKYSFGSATAGVAVILNKNGIIGKGISSQLFFSKKVIKEINKGQELGSVLDDITGRKNVKHQEGAFGLFTNNLVTRKDAYTHAIACALSRFIKKELWQ